VNQLLGSIACGSFVEKVLKYALSPILRRSKYRVVGKLFDTNMIEYWLYGNNFPLKFNYFDSKS
jgi:hypothetical protein